MVLWRGGAGDHGRRRRCLYSRSAWLECVRLAVLLAVVQLHVCVAQSVKPVPACCVDAVGICIRAICEIDRVASREVRLTCAYMDGDAGVGRECVSVWTEIVEATLEGAG